MDIRPYLEDLETRIDEAVEDDIFDQWKRFCTGRFEGEVFSPKRKAKAAPPRIEWPKLSVNQSMKSPDEMILHQLAGCSDTICGDAGRLMNVRASYGVVILAMPFGCELFLMKDEANSLPNCHPLGEQKARAWADKGMPDVDHPYLQQAWEVGRRLAKIQRDYPKIAKYAYVYHPDLQGPMDILELIWGSDIFLTLIDEPDLIHRMLQLITDFYTAVLRKWQSIVPPFDREVSCHWGYMQPGQIMIRDDSAMNLPPEMFEEYIKPYDQRLLQTFGTGSIHACGRVDHWTRYLHQMPGAKALQMSQPHLNKMDQVIRDTVDRGICLLDLNATAVRELQAAGQNLRGRVSTFM